MYSTRFPRPFGIIFTGVLLSVSVFLDSFVAGHCDVQVSQASKAVGASQAALIDVLKGIRHFRRPETYSEVPPAAGNEGQHYEARD
jgi:hypothetical protein